MMKMMIIMMALVMMTTMMMINIPIYIQAISRGKWRLQISLFLQVDVLLFSNMDVGVDIMIRMERVDCW